MRLSNLPIRRIAEDGLSPAPRDQWPHTLPPVRQLLDQGLDFGPATIFVGENGSGKSTLVEAVALGYGLSPEGGSTGAQHSTRVTESGLERHLQLVRNVGASRRGYFLRAETMHGLYTYLEDNPSMRRKDPEFHTMSHGESFLELMVDRFRAGGLWVMDEPESALSFSGSLALVGILKDLIAEGNSQVVMSTHSPLLAALPGADIYEVGPWGLRAGEWESLDLVANWRSFMNMPGRYLRHL
ncbi:AAA family ATPase [Paeniglutamicibacter sp. ZC-3]|uniref:AAA family ATPase n=1 Tax=Paeniglutamicibacter sp. ZC-3 TaxID=2986919 RepID=UPI0021F79CD6|nr:AAA family ATPase [Paeniglutamicibacter sp. ZC-3]MCV9993681.1 AAA family ATPase [Paeniglutamicibacter sp. ZC-3]